MNPVPKKRVMRPILAKAYHLLELKEFDAQTRIDNLYEAMRLAGIALTEDRNDVLALFCMGRVFVSLRSFGAAYHCFSKCIEMTPADWEPMVNVSLTLISMNEFVESERLLHKVLKMNPDATTALNNMALIQVNLGNPAKAIEYAERSLAIDPTQPDPKESRGYANLMLGNFKAGWEGYEAMLEGNEFRHIKSLHGEGERYWKGEKGGTLYLQYEQGLGDEISFASVLNDAMRDNDIIVEVNTKLEGLFRRSFPTIEVTTKNNRTRRKPDYVALIGSLCHHYRNDVKDFPGTPYLEADVERRLQWRALLDTLPGRKVGIAWSGGLHSTFAARRSLSLEALLPVLSIPGISWVSLQYKDPTREIEAFEREHGIYVNHWKRAAESNDYDDQAALVEELDCVVTVTTSIAHLCGALGKQAFVLVPSKPRWFYGSEGITVPWYNSLRLFRQTDQWPLESVRDALVKRFASVKQAA